MRTLSVAAIMRGNKARVLPNPNHCNRIVYDALYERRGNFVDLNFLDLKKSPLSGCIANLIDFWGCDIERQWSKYVDQTILYKLRGEWQDHNYISYLHLHEGADPLPTSDKLKKRFQKPLKKSVKTWVIIPPGEEPQLIQNLNKFCRANGLNITNMYAVAYGRTKHYLGWKVEHYTAA